MRRLLLCSSGALLLAYLVVTIGGAVILTESSLHLPRKAITQRAGFERIVEDQFGARIEDVTLRTSDATNLKAWHVRPKKWNGSEVILLHGVTDNREGMEGHSRLFLKAGYAVLLPDSRAHGESGGKIATYGVLERNDVSAWEKWLQTGSAGCVYLFGESMGDRMQFPGNLRKETPPTVAHSCGLKAVACNAA